MNIVEAYLKYNKQLIVVVSGLSGSNKTSIAKFIERDFKIHMINIEKYIINYTKIVKLLNGTKLIDWDSIDSFDWNKINDEIGKTKSNGVVICGPYFPSDKITHNINFHIQIKVAKQILIEKRYEYIKSHPEKFESLEDINTQLVESIVNQVTYPHFLDYTEKSKIDKYVNSKNLTIDQIYDQIADYLFYKIKDYLHNRNKTKSVFEDKNSNLSNNNLSDDDSSSSNSTIVSDSSSIEMESPVLLRDFNDYENYQMEWDYVRTGTKIKDKDF
jgi:uridine kinase